MTTMLRFKHLLFVCALVAAGLAVSANNAYASHFRYGTITWSVQNPATPNIITLRVDSVWRWSFPYGTTAANLCPAGFVPSNPSVGSGSCPPLGTVLASLGTIIIRNAGNVQVASVNLTPTVTSINSTEDWFSAVYQVNVTLPIGLTANYTATFSSNARISTLLGGNNDQVFTITSGITIRYPPQQINQPPTTGTLPIVVLARTQPTSFQIAASDPNGDAMTFRLSTAAESGLVQIVPPGLTLSPAGVVAWAPTINGLYALQVRVTDTQGAFTVVDLILQVKDAVGQPPVVKINGTAGPKTLSAVRGTPVTFTVGATDPETKPVMLTSNSLPSGAIMTPSLPLTAVNPLTTFNWTPPANGLGTYVMSFAGLDGDGRQASNTMTLTVTNNPPTIACTPFGNTLEAVSPAGALFSISANVNDLDNDKVTVSFFVDGVQRQISGLLTPPGVPTQSYSATFALGHHTYEGRVGDGLSNVSCTGVFDIVDTTAPSILVTPGDQTITATSPAGAVATYAVSAHDDVDLTPSVSCSPVSGGTFPIGTTIVSCTATDDSGNRNDTTFTVHVTDPTPPTVTPHVTGTLGNNGWYTDNVAVTWTTEDLESGIASTDGCEAQLVSADTAGVTFTCSATNNDGVASAPVSITVKRDATAPSVVFTPASIAAEATSGAGAAVTFAPASATDALSGVAGAVSCTQPSGTTFPLGASTVTCSASDEAGNPGSGSLSIAVADTTAPTIDAHGNETADATSATGAIVSYLSPATHDVVDGDGTASCVLASGSMFAVGVNTVTCTATDAQGNQSHAAFSVTVVDTPPVIDPHVNESAEATSASGAAVTYLSPIAHDLVDGTAPVSCSPASGSTFAIGTTAVTCSAIDTAGNHAPPTSFTVTVVDTTVPAIDAHADLSAPATSASGAVVLYTSPATHDAVDGDGVASCTLPSGSTFPLGPTTVTCSAADAHGNHAVDTTFTVTVTNNLPTFTPPVDITVEATSPAGAVATFVAEGHDVESGTLTAACSLASGSTFAVGGTPVSCTVTDGAGATASGSFTVTVTDHTVPVLNLPADLIVHPAGPSGAVVTYAATATDIVDVTVPVVCTPASGSNFPIGTTTVNCSATDAHHNIASGLFHVTVTNTPPVAVNNAYSGQWNTLLSIAAKGVLTNDTDAEGDVLSATLGTGPTHGTLTLNANGGFTYMPAANYYGADSFTYRANDGRGGVSGLATVALTITTTCPLIADRDRGHDRDHDFGRDQDHDWNHDWSDDDDDDRSCARGTAVAQNDTYYTKQATTLTVPVKGVLINDGRYAVIASLIAAPVYGTVTLNPNGTFVYVPAADFFGIDTFVYVARNSAGVAGPVATARIIVKKNLAPDADNDYYSTKRNTTLTVSSGSGVLSGDSDPNGDAITAVLVTGPAHGTLTMTATGSFVYKPATSFSGTDTFTYKAQDPLGLTDTATVTIRVNVSGGHDDGHESHHHDGDDCDHEQHRNGHFDGDGCEHDRQHS